MVRSTKLCWLGGVVLVTSTLALACWRGSLVGSGLRGAVGMSNINISRAVDWTWQGYLEVGVSATSARAVGEGDAAVMLERREAGEDGDGAAALFRVTIWVVSSSQGWWAPVWRTYRGELGIEDAWLSSAPDAALGALLRDVAIDEAARAVPSLDRERIGEALHRAKIGADGRATAEAREINLGGVVHNVVTVAGLVLVAVGVVTWTRKRGEPPGSCPGF